MLKKTEDALIELEQFLKPEKIALLADPQALDSELTEVAANSSALSAALGMKVGLEGAELEAFIKSPLITIINQILGAQGDNQPVFAMEQLANMLVPQAVTSEYETKRDIMVGLHQAAESDLTTFFNGLLQSPAGGFVIQDHDSVYKMYPENVSEGVGLRTEKVENADKETPTKANPTFGYIAILDPRLNYSRTSADIASTMTRAIPSLEFSKCVPFFKLSIMTPSSVVHAELQDITSDMSYGKFFEGSFSTPLQDMSGRTNIIGVEDDDFSQGAAPDAGAEPSESRFTGTTGIGMEAFTMPQSIVPTGQANDAWNSEFANNKYTSIDRTRPFMSIDSFSVSIKGTRGSSAAQRAKLDLTLHDRGRLREIKSLLKPATLNQVEFTVEYGWSHPDGNITSDNVYGKLINSMKNKATYTLSNSGYSFQPDGQVKITLDMVTKGIEAINTVDSSATGNLAPLSEAVEAAYRALTVARSIASNELTVSAMGGAGASQTISTLTLQNVGTLISSETKDSIQKWIDDASSDGSPRKLQELGRLLEKVRDAAADRSAAMITDLELKLSILSSKSYNDWSTFIKADLLTPADTATSSGAVDFYNITKNGALPSGWQNQRGKYAPLAALLQIFVVHPLYETGLYDEVQLVTYTANTTAGAAACANLGSIPIDLQSIAGNNKTTLKKVLVNEYKRQGGQYPVNRMIDFINRMFIQPHMSVCYGFAPKDQSDGRPTGNSGINYDMETGEVTFDEVSENVQSNISKLLREYYYGDDYEGDPFDRRPTNFTPINLRLVFDVSKSNPAEINDRSDGSLVTPMGEKTVLRIHVIDEAATERPDIMNFLKDTSMLTSGVIIPNTPKIAAGMSRGLRLILFGDSFNLNDDKLTCEKLKENGIFASYSAPPETLDQEIKNNLQARRAEMVALRGDTSKTSREINRINTYIDVIDGRLNATDAKDIQAYYLAASPHRLIRFCSQAAPNIIYGEEGSVVQQISIKSGGSSAQNSMFMRRALESGASGDSAPSRGVPMRIKPAVMSIDMLGNPNVKYRQNFFINTGTGTSIDNLYAVAGLDHNITPDSFKTSIKLVNQDAYGVFNNLISNIDEVAGAVSTLHSRMLREIGERHDAARDAALGARASRLSAAARATITGYQQVAIIENQITSMIRGYIHVYETHERIKQEEIAEWNAAGIRPALNLSNMYMFLNSGQTGDVSKIPYYQKVIGPFKAALRESGRAINNEDYYIQLYHELRDLGNFPQESSNPRFHIQVGTVPLELIQETMLIASYKDDLPYTSRFGATNTPILFNPLNPQYTDKFIAAGVDKYLTLITSEVSTHPVVELAPGEEGPAAPPTSTTGTTYTVYTNTSIPFTAMAAANPNPGSLDWHQLQRMKEGWRQPAIGTFPGGGVLEVIGVPASIISKYRERNNAIEEIVQLSQTKAANIQRAGLHTPSELEAIRIAQEDGIGPD